MTLITWTFGGYVVGTIIGLALGFWLCDRFHPARFRLNEIKLLMRQQNEVILQKGARWSDWTHWSDVFDKVAPYEES